MNTFYKIARLCFLACLASLSMSAHAEMGPNLLFISMDALSFAAAGEEQAPASKPKGAPLAVTFVNAQKGSVELFWMDREGNPKSYGLIKPKKQKAQQTRPGDVWSVSDAESGQPLGYFVVGDREAKAVVAIDRSSETHEHLDVKGWEVHLNDSLRESIPDETEKMLELLTKQLDRVTKILPDDVLKRLREIPIWINPTYPDTRPGAAYHPNPDWLSNNGRDPVMGKAIEITNVQIFPFENRRMPYLMLHELAHAYHDRVLGFDRGEIIAAFERARDSGGYEEVKRFNGKSTVMDKAYAMSNHKEYFAELTEAYFGKNDFFPFDHQELKAHDPMGFETIEKMWLSPSE